jgi:hypothetical protein
VLTVLTLIALTGCRPDYPEITDIGADPLCAYLSVTGTGPSDVWVAGADDGQGGMALHFDGTSWTRLAVPWRDDLWWVHQFGPNHVMFAGNQATVLEWDGTELKRHLTPGIARDTVYGLWGSAPDDVWAVGGWAGRWGFLWHYDGETWQDVQLPDGIALDANGELPALFKVWGRAADDVYAVGGNGLILHYDGAAWAIVPSGTTARLFTVTGTDDDVAIVGGDANGVVLIDSGDGFEDATPDGAPVLQGVTYDRRGDLWVTGKDAAVFVRHGKNWEFQPDTVEARPESLHSAWHDGDALWAVGGAVLSGSLDQGQIRHGGDAPEWTPPAPPDPPVATCPTDAVDPVPDGSIARKWNELMLDSIRRDIPRPGVHARNLHHVSLAMWDAWATYDDVADPYLYAARTESAVPEADREIAISYAAYRVLTHRYATAIGGAVSTQCYDAFMAEQGLDPADTHTDGDDPIAVGNRIGDLVNSTYADDGANEAANYADTTGWAPVNTPIVVDQPALNLVDPDAFTQLNIGLAETQNGIVLPSGLQGYIGAQWGGVTPFAIPGPLEGEVAPPSVTDPEMRDWVVDVLQKTAWLDVSDPTTIDISPGAYGNNPIGTNDGVGHAINPVTGAPYAANVVKRSDFGRVLAEFWADGPKSETPPGHWNTIANRVSDAIDPAELRIGGVGPAVDRLQWDVSLYLAVNGAVHDAGITAWGLKREYTAARPIQYIRWMAHHGQSSDPALPGYDPDGLPLVPGVIELITAESSAPGQRHERLRPFIGEVAIYAWRGEPDDRANEVGGHRWDRAIEWIPYQRRTFVTPAFPGFISGHSTFSRAAAEVLTSFTGSAYFPGGLGEYVAPQNAYLIFEDGPSETLTLQWGSYYDAADQAGQSRIWGGIHIWPDDTGGRRLGAECGFAAYDKATQLHDGTFRAD